ncbi:uncharacterized protein VDAG_00576 [Verticillium dahliae VdLs.17]|uniref:Uncharacterized protein n=1 Tax=Verticillium dahliae (strain VdLs.17 / ATCC MYA-4575 / FGSC 10137) TaxID=498257 RepID=G2WQD4_VERDV|nr:uncharacterized protein VDAG_00576 [Verticillium dahliae VdLs.17]EGY13894.1 hypothetical protein VDAG_00576 [Verticillium dahliae VdLs.17]
MAEKRSMRVLRDQPLPVPRPYAGRGQEPHRSGSASSSEKGHASKKSFASSVRASLSVRRRLRSSSNTAPRRPQISAPSDFRHLHSESFQFPQYSRMQSVSRRPPLPPSFRPIELSIYMPNNELSPILPHFEYPSIITAPSAARLPESRVDDFTLNRQLSYTSMSFHIPRKPKASPQTSYEESPPRVPPKSRARAYTAPNVAEMKVRIASAMNEVEKLQREIDSAIERQSLYAASSRPSTAHSMAPTGKLYLHENHLTRTCTTADGPAPLEMEPMPSIPALPPAAPSFSERLSQERPRTAPSQLPVRIPRRAKTFAEASAAFITPPPSREGPEHQPPPPLPLVLRPPLRKKKSFSRVSSWLFPGGAAAAEHSRDMSFDSVTNLPRPVKGREGFYQCVSPPEGAGGRRSCDSTATVSTWTSEDEDQTAPTTTWSPGSTPLTKQHEEVPLERVSTFGKERGAKTFRRPSVGMAF